MKNKSAEIYQEDIGGIWILTGVKNPPRRPLHFYCASGSDKEHGTIIKQADFDKEGPLSCDRCGEQIHDLYTTETIRNSDVRFFWETKKSR